VGRDVSRAGTVAGKQYGESMSRSVGGSLKGIAGALGGVLAVGKVGSFLKDSVAQSSDLNETLSKSRTIFGSNAADVEKWSRTSASSFGLSRAAALDAAAQFGNMFQQLGFTGAESARTSKSLVKTAADLGSFNNVDPSDVLDRIGAAMRGEYDSLQQLIPNISAARVEQEALSATGKSSATQLTAQEKATATLAIVQRDGAKAAGDFAKTSGGLANQQRIAAAQVGDLKAAIGDALAPAITSLVQVGTTQFLPFLTDLAQRRGPAVAEAVSRAGRAVAGFFTPANLQRLAPLRQGLADLADAWPAVSSAGRVAGQVMAFVADHADLLAKLMPVLVAAFVAYKAAQLANNVVGKDSLVGFIAQTAATVTLALANRSLAKSIAGSTLTSQADVAVQQQSLVSRIRNTVALVAQRVATAAAAVATRAYAAGQWLLNAALSANPIGIVVVAIAGLAAALVIAYRRSETFRTIVQGAWDGFRAAVSAAWGVVSPILAAIGRVVGTTLVAVFRTYARVVGAEWALVHAAATGAWKIIRPVLVALGQFIGVTVPAAFETGRAKIDAKWTAAKERVKAVWDRGLKPVLTAVNTFINTTVPAAFESGRVKIGTKWSAVRDRVRDVWDKSLKPVFQRVNTFITDTVPAAFESGRVAIGTKWSAVRDRVKNVWDKSLKPVFTAVNTMIQTTVPNAFDKGVEAIKTAWDKVKGYVKEPVRFVINTVLNHGLLAGFNSVAEKVLSAGAAKKIHINSIPLPKGFAEGTEDHRAQIARPNQLRVWAEPETGGEAYIPLAQRKRARSTAILSKVAQHFGYGLTQFANGGTLIKAGKHLRQLGYSVAEGPAPFGPVHRVHTANSAHYRGLALDINHGAGTSRAEQAALDRIVPYLKGLGLRVIWRAPGHYNHLHTEATGKGNILGRLASGAGDLLSSLDPRKLIGKGLDKLGGIPGAGSTLAKIVGGVPRKLMGMLVDKAKDIVASVNPFSDTSDPSGGGGGGANRWAGVARQVLAELGRPAGELGALLRRIQFESGGNPKAINLTDSNARAGHPSRGLMQTIPATFNAFAGKYRSRGIYDPLANIYAGSRYAIRTYGSLSAIDPRNRPKGYDRGGILPPGGLGANYGRAPERVLTPSNTASFDRLVRMLETGGVGGGGVQFNAPVYTQTPEEFARRLAADQRLHEALHPTF
jgi:SLT domain-containing protein